ncbi:branched-chain amino acid aminotransferase [Pseudohaliea sp.]|uniref:branched-chain amino acid aminotransferase n=1 Tax=Pseudohaliea sp. TaxID=2740289 RepID=UPI0032EE3E12
MHQEISIDALPRSARGKAPEAPAFGATFADHMFCQRYSEQRGWHEAAISPLSNLSLHPAAAVLHYGQEIFEGLKAYRGADGKIRLFRPLDNCRRFNASARRMVMPTVDESFHLEALRRLVALDERWVPDTPGSALYIRPAMIASSARLGLGASADYLHFVICSPVGAYFKTGFEPVSVLVAENDRRAVRGGVGEAKTGGNYAASLSMSERAGRQGYNQVLWLDAIQGRFVEEVGAMNICFVYDGRRIVTPALSGSILPGITRASVLELAPALGYEVVEAEIDLGAALDAIAAGTITEVFGCGTAAVIAPVDRIGHHGRDYLINSGKTGPVAATLHDALTGIQYGTRPDPYGWTVTIDTE